MRSILAALLVCLPSADLFARGTASLPASQDNTLYFSATGSLSNGAGMRFFAGVNGFGLEQRGLIQFDVAAAVPPGATITAVDLVLTMEMTAGVPLNIDLRRVTQSWGEGASNAASGEGGGATSLAGDATWIHRFYPGSNWTSPGGDFSATPSATLSVGSTGVYTWTSTAQMVADAQGWLDDPTSNHGWLLLSPGIISGNGKGFASRENPVATSRPRLMVTYNDPTAGVTYGAGCAGSGGFVPGLQITGNFNPGGMLTVTVDQALGGAQAFLALGLNQAAIPMGGGCLLNVSPLLIFAGPLPLSGAGAGNGMIALPATIPPGTPPAKLTMQAFVADPGGAPPGFANSHGVLFSVL